MLKTPANLLAGNERTGGRGGKEEIDRQASRQRWRKKDGNSENKEQKEEEGAVAGAEKGWVGEGWRWSN